jgi:type IV secretory pathway VirB4 component
MIDLGIMKIAEQGRARISEKDRFRHLYVLGKTQTGKSTFFLNLIKQELDHAIIVLDPAGSFANAVASLAPPGRLIYVDKDNPLVLNPLRRKASRSEIANHLIEVVNNCVTGTTPSIEITVLMGEIIRNAIRVLRDNELEIDYLCDFLNYEHIRDSYRNDKYWEHFDAKENRVWYKYREKRESALRVASRLSAFILDDNLRKFTIGDDQFNVKSIIENKQVVCFDFKGLDNDLMLYLGNLITTAVKFYYMQEATTKSDPLFFYVDEFQNFLSPAFNNMLAECAKYKISVNLAHHILKQVSDKTLNMALGNCFTKVVFSCGYDEAQRMANEFQLKEKDFLDLFPYHAQIRIGNKNHLVRTYAPPEITEFKPDKQPPLTKINFLRDSWIPYGKI